jgi:hypothetical protein
MQQNSTIQQCIQNTRGIAHLRVQELDTGQHVKHPPI